MTIETPTPADRLSEMILSKKQEDALHALLDAFHEQNEVRLGLEILRRRAHVLGGAVTAFLEETTK